MLCPDDFLTRAEMATIINRAFNAEIAADIAAYSDVSAFDWYHNEFGKALNMQTFYGTGDNMFRPQNTITREEVFIAIARALVVSTNDYSALDRFSDGSAVSSWAKEYVAALVADGYINGYGDGTILPKNNITRAEFAQLLYNIFKQYISAPGTYNDVVNNGGVVIRNEGISLSDVTINGDLVIADGVGDGILTLKNVRVNGRLLVRGSQRITVINSEFTGGIVVKNVNGTVHFDNYRSEAVFSNLKNLTEVTFKGDSFYIGVGGSGGGSGSISRVTYSDVIFDFGGGNVTSGNFDIENSMMEWENGDWLSPSDLPGEKDLKKDNYVFGGWYTDNNFKNEFTGSRINSDLHLYAKWMVLVTFYSDGVEYSSKKIEIGAKVNPPLTDPEKEGYAFKYWYKDSEGVSFDFDTNIEINTNLYAKFVKLHTVTFYTDVDMNETIFAEPLEVEDKTKIADKDRPSDPKKNGYTFVGWINDATGKAFDFTSQITDDMKIYADWTYSISFKDSHDSSEISSVNGKFGEDAQAPSEDPEKTGWVFAGWYKNVECTEKFDFANIDFDSYKEEETISVYAKWDPDYVKIIIYPKWPQSDENYEYSKDGKPALRGSSISRPVVENPGFRLIGWYTTPDFKEGTEVDFNTYKFTKDETTVYSNWEETDEKFTVRFFKGMTLDENGDPLEIFENKNPNHPEGLWIYTSGSIIANNDYPADKVLAPKQGYYKDGSISPLYATNAEGLGLVNGVHLIDLSWFYQDEDGKWVEFDIYRDTVQSDLVLHNGSKYLEGFIKLKTENGTYAFTIDVPYETKANLDAAGNEEAPDNYLANTFKDLLFMNKDIIQNAYNNALLDSKKAELMAKLTGAGLIDADKNILIQNINLKFSDLIGKENLREFIVENAKKQLAANNGLKDTLTNYIDSHSAYDIERLIIKAIDKQLNNPLTRDETVEMIEDLVLDIIERNSSMFADMVEEYIETEIQDGRGDEVEALIVDIITKGMDADTLKTVALKVDMKPYINEYIDTLTIDELKSYYDKIVNKFISNPNFKTYINEYVGVVDDATIKAFMKGYINQSGEGKVFTDYLTDMDDTTLAKYISDNLKDVIDDTDINKYITDYINGLSEAKFKEYTKLYITGLDASTKESYIKSYLNTLTEDELASKVADYVVGLTDVVGELSTYIGRISDSDLVEYISDYIKENTTNSTIIEYIIDYVKAEIASATPDATVMGKVTDFITTNASSIDEVKNVMKDVLPKYAKTISEATIKDRISDYFNTTDGQADFTSILRRYLASEGYTQIQIDAILSNDAEIAAHKTEAIAYVVDEIKKDNSEVFQKDPVTGEFTNTWVNVDKVATSFISNATFVSEMLTVAGVMGEILTNGDAINVITSKSTFRTQIMTMLVDPSNQTVMNSAVHNVISNPLKKADVVNKVITSLLSGDDSNDKAEIKALVLKMISKQGKATSVNDLAGYLKDNLDSNDYALNGAVDYIYTNRSTEIANIVAHIKKPSAATLVSKIAVEIVAVPEERAEIIGLIVSFITKPANEGKKNEIIDDAINKLVADNDELVAYISNIFDNDDALGTNKNTLVKSIKNVIFADSSTAKADIKEFVNVIISSQNTFGKETLINTYVDDIWGVETKKNEFIGKIAHEFVTNPLVRTQVMGDTIDAINGNPTLKEELVAKLIAFIEESDDHMEAVIEKVVQKMMGDGTTPGDDTLKEEMIDFIVKYLDNHPEDLDEIVDDVLEDDTNVDGELADILNEFIRQLVEEDKFIINTDNKFIAEGMKLKLSEMDEYKELFDMLPSKVETLYKKIEALLPRDIIQEIYSRTITAYLDQLNAGINAVTETATGEAETFITLTINPVTDLLNPLYDRAMEKADNKLEDRFFYNENEYLQEVIDILTPATMFNGDDSLGTDILSGYSFKEFEDYYFLLMRLSVLTDDTAQWYMDNIGQEKTEELMGTLESRVLKAFSYYNKLLAVLDEYTKSGNVPDKLDDEYVDKFINILDSKFPFFDRLLNKFDDSKVDRPLNDSDYDKLYKVVELLFRNRSFAADDLYDSSYADEIDKVVTRKGDTYTVANEKVGSISLARTHK